MVSETVSPSIDQGRKLMFRDNYLMLKQQEMSRIAQSPAVMMLPPEGYSHNMARIGRTELEEVNVRNPDKQYADYALDNRRYTKRRFTRTFVIDNKQDVDEQIADPTSSLVQTLVWAANRVEDRIAAAAAVGAVLTGAPDGAATSTSAADDGVITVDATGGVTYAKIQEITENFINNDLNMMDLQGSVLNITGTENTDLMSQTNFISNDFIDGRPVMDGYQDKSGMYFIERFAGSNASITVPTPILAESGGTRKCFVAAPQAIALSSDINDLRVEKSATKVNSWEITIDYWVGAMRTEGARVQIFNTTIAT